MYQFFVGLFSVCKSHYIMLQVCRKTNKRKKCVFYYYATI